MINTRLKALSDEGLLVIGCLVSNAANGVFQWAEAMLLMGGGVVSKVWKQGF